MDVKATNRETLRFCVDVSRPYSRLLIRGLVCVILGVLVDGVATPLVFADALERIVTSETARPASGTRSGRW